MEILRITSSTDAVSALEFQTISGAYLVAGSDNASAKIFDAVTQTGVEKFSLKSLANEQSEQVSLRNFTMRNGISVTLTGTAPVLYLFIE